ncbi:hypothetical protein [Clostridium oryzae]|uniref:Uncharacterized protein n=1 Tax=Clostridium oryzae TaxID=1450648 RepID=A0A1V4IE41_9CLOT|nr:hypothetical protein [Clostridium oryzae]OPJ58262.1 hypothetical protein CLORY_36820 [Clostridium oryzae]
MIYLIYTLLLGLLALGIVILRKTISKLTIQQKLSTSNNIQTYTGFMDIWDEYDEDDDTEE